MKRLFSGFVIILIIAITLLSCKNKEKKMDINNTNNGKDTVSTLNKDAYQPGLNWKLAWSDEFETDTINVNNWN